MIHLMPGRGTLGAATAMTCVGSLTAVSALIAHYPVFGGQAVRYAVAALVLSLAARYAGRRERRTRPTLREWVYLTLLAATGLAAFNVCIVLATRDTGPATIGTVIAASPIALALIGPLLQRRRPTPALVASACVVVAGAALASGLGGGTAHGLLLALGALGGEVCFSLLAVPVLPRLGPLRVSAYSAGLAAPMLLVIGLVADGRGVVRVPTGTELAGLAYLSVLVTAVAFLIWYDALGRLGPDRAGLFAGLIPVSAVATTWALGLGRPSTADLVGAGLVAAGVVIGIRAPRPPAAPVRTADVRAAAPAQAAAPVLAAATAPAASTATVPAGAPEGGRTL